MTGRSLLLGSSPAAVLFAVGPVIVDPVEIRPRRSGGHVVVEGGEVSPAIIDRDPPAAVSAISRGFRIGAPLDHAGMHLPQCRFPQSVSVVAVAPQTATGLRASVAQPFGKDDFLGAAVAQARPACAASVGFARDLEADDETAKSLAGKLNKNGHGSLHERLSDLVAARLRGARAATFPQHSTRKAALQ